jgi:Fe-S cluster biogenesis protein NfuA
MSEHRPAIDAGFEQRIGRIESRLAEIERAATPAVCDAARDVVAALLELHGAGLARILELARERGAPLAEAFAQDELLANLLVLHDLHPDSLTQRVERAVAKLRIRAAAEHRHLELISVADGVVHLRLAGEGAGCASSAARLQQEVEQTIWEAAPDARRVEVQLVAAPSGFVSLESLLAGSSNLAARSGT